MEVRCRVLLLLGCSLLSLLVFLVLPVLLVLLALLFLPCFVGKFLVLLVLRLVPGPLLLFFV